VVVSAEGMTRGLTLSTMQQVQHMPPGHVTFDGQLSRKTSALFRTQKRDVTAVRFIPVFLPPLYTTVFKPLYTTVFKPLYTTVFKPLYTTVFKPLYTTVFKPLYTTAFTVFSPSHFCPVTVRCWCCTGCRGTW